MQKIVPLIVVVLLIVSLSLGQSKIGGTAKVGGTVKVAIQAATETNFVNDLFNESSDVDLTTHTPDLGGAWIEHTSSDYIDPLNVIGADDSVYKSLTNPGMDYNNATPPSADYCVEAVMRVKSVISANAAIAWRVNTSENTMMVFQINNGTGWRMRKIVWNGSSAVQTTIGSEDTTTSIPSVGQARTMKACSVGNTHTAYIDGVLLGTVGGTDSDITAAGKCGMRFSGTFTTSTGYHFESFRCFTP